MMAPIILDVFEGNESSRRLHSSGTRHGFALIPSGNTSPEKHVLSFSHMLRYTGSGSLVHTYHPVNSYLNTPIHVHSQCKKRAA
ncbi:hypothetical protein DPMN_145194 [Dreissena polymorpha]|uniref:Uncharacterized protein n=1 Tax=Dreissena polymorpha TaxID=45954 RepID=A0A9D4IYK5_DREPO|nr:hypothetical protein DPMN_145194 [Dreissena polymorpha]